LDLHVPVNFQFFQCEIGKLSISQKRGIIKLIPEKDANLEVPISSKVFIFLSDSIYHPVNFCERKKIDFYKMESFLEVLKRSNLPPIWSIIRTSLPLVWNEL